MRAEARRVQDHRMGAMDRLEGYRLLMLIERSGSLAGAARELRMAPWTLTRRLKALEAQLGVMLVDRDPQRAVLTAEGRTLLAGVVPAIDAIRAAEDSVGLAAIRPSGLVRLQLSSAVAAPVLARLPEFVQRYPDVALEVSEAGGPQAQSSQPADLTVALGWPEQYPERVVQVLAQTRFLYVAAPVYWDRHGRPTHPSQLAGHRLAVFRKASGRPLDRWRLARGAEEVQVDAHAAPTFANRGWLDAYVAAGGGVAQLADLTVRRAIESGALQALDWEWEGLEAPGLLAMMAPAGRRVQRVRVMLDWLRRVFVDEEAARPGPRPRDATALPGWLHRERQQRRAAG